MKGVGCKRLDFSGKCDEAYDGCKEGKRRDANEGREARCLGLVLSGGGEGQRMNRF